MGRLPGQGWPVRRPIPRLAGEPGGPSTRPRHRFCPARLGNSRVRRLGLPLYTAPPHAGRSPPGAAASSLTGSRCRFRGAYRDASVAALRQRPGVRHRSRWPSIAGRAAIPPVPAYLRRCRGRRDPPGQSISGPASGLSAGPVAPQRVGSRRSGPCGDRRTRVARPRRKHHAAGVTAARSAGAAPGAAVCPASRSQGSHPSGPSGGFRRPASRDGLSAMQRLRLRGRRAERHVMMLLGRWSRDSNSRWRGVVCFAPRPEVVIPKQDTRSDAGYGGAFAAGDKPFQRAFGNSDARRSLALRK